MSKLAVFQERFGRLLDSGAHPEDVALSRALAIHRNTSAKAALDALAANYPVTRRLIGDEAFHACARDFVGYRPPADPRLCVYGDTFPAQVAAWRAFTEYPYLGPVAALERLVLEALFAADAAPLDADRLAHGVDPDMPLALHPAARTLTFNCPAVSIWQAHQRPDFEALTLPSWDPEIALVTRPGHRVEVRVIDPATHAFLTSPTLGEAAVAAHAQGGDVAGIFSSLLVSGAFA